VSPLFQHRRSKLWRLGILAAVITVSVWAAGSLCFAQSADVTPHIERLGNPGKLTYPSDEKTFARNVWDLKAFAGRLYIGLGNRANSGPAPNAGPVDIWHFAPESGRFVKEWTAPDEQVESFRIIDGQLVVPGNDPMESWEFGNFYVSKRTDGRRSGRCPTGSTTST
jgi:hypothetical protein